MKPIELLLSILLLTCVALMLFYVFKAKVEYDEHASEVYSLSNICEQFKDVIKNIINMDMYVLNLNDRDIENRRAIKNALSGAIRKCSQGDRVSKSIVVARAKYTLSNIMKINATTIEYIIPFNDSKKLTATDKFEILLYLQKRDRNYKMFQGICELAKLDKLLKDTSGYYYCINDEDIHKAYSIISHKLSFDDKMNVLAQRVYEETYGLSVVDLLIMDDISLDSISGGVSGITTRNYAYMEDDIATGNHKRSQTYESVWVIYKGKPIHLKFLSFKSNKSIRRICKNLVEHGRIGHLTAAEGAARTHLVDGTRITVFRPSNALQWTFFVRKFANTAFFELKDLVIDQGGQYPIELIRWAIHGCVNIFFSGDQNSGKTTYARAAIKEIDKRQAIRTLEADFELYLNDAYSDKNILATRPSERLPFPRLIELLKSSEAHTIIFGETASLEHAKHLINLLLAGTKRVITTGHWPTSDELVSYFVHSLGGYSNTTSGNIQSMVARLIHLDIHCVKENDGHRHIDRITEIIPYDNEERPPNGVKGVSRHLWEISHYLKLLAREKHYYTRDIIIYEGGRYVMLNPISDGLSKVILHNLPPDMRQAFLEFNKVEKGDVVEIG